MRILICGSTTWDNPVPIIMYLGTLPPDTVIIHGAARGADMLADEYAKKRGLTTKPYPAKWPRYGKAAGIHRNTQMLVEGQPDKVVAFITDLTTTRGSRDTVTKAFKSGLPVSVFTTDTGWLQPQDLSALRSKWIKSRPAPKQVKRWKGERLW